MKFKRLIACVLAFVTVCSGGCISVHAAKTVTYNTLDSIAEDLDIFKTISSGTISAVKVGDTWYYQFARKGQTTVRIKATAFMTTPKNTHLEKDNCALNDSLAKQSNHNYDRICYYNTMTATKGYHYTTYSTSMYRLRLEVGGASDEFTTKCELTHGVRFTYNTKVQRRTVDFEAGLPKEPRNVYSAYVTPSTAVQYMDALKRTSSVGELVPTATVSVTNTGKNNLYLSRYTVSGKGNASTSDSGVKGLIDLVYSTGSLGKSVVTAVVTPNFFSVAGAFKSLADMDMGRLAKTSKQYNTGKELALSINKRYVYKTAYTSPIKLSKAGDWMQVVTKCNTSISDAKFNVVFSFK